MALVHLDGLGVWGLLVGVAWLGLSPAVFLAPVHDRLEALARRMAGAEVRIPLLGAGDVASLAPWYAAMWLAWSAGFQLLVVALWTGPTPWSVGLIFPLAAGLGMMAVVLPGGLGAREGVMVSCLALAGMPVAEATSAAITARLWFLLGEGSVFVAGWLADRALGAGEA